MFGSFGVTELIIILIILLLIFGPSRLGDLGSSLGKGIKGFRKSLKDDEIDITPVKEEDKKVSDAGLDGFSAPKSSNKEQSTK
ncbi:MAG: twin-arginine translocase TatA/TatE family subunit [Thermodesulfobacteriota bacterium]